MDYSILFENGKTGKSDQVQDKIPAAGNRNKGNGSKKSSFSQVKKGQLISGRVISVKDKVTLDFHGQKVEAPRNVFKNVIPGETKTFEVVKASEKEIELKPLEGNSDSRHTFKAVRQSDNNWDIIMSHKDTEAKKAEKEAESKDQADKLAQIGTKMTEKDCSLLEQEGFAVEDFTINGLYEAVNRVKTSNQEHKPEEEKDNRTSFDSETIAARLKEANLPVTGENLANVMKALDLCTMAEKLDDKAMQYLISRAAAPSIENIYKACYSGTMQKQPLSEKEWSELEGQAAEVIKEAGYPVNDDNLHSARWLIEQQLPLTSESFIYKKELEDIRTIDKGTALDRIMEGLKSGLDPMEVSLINPAGTDTEQIIADINSITPEAVTQAVNSGIQLTIRNLASIQESLADSGYLGKAALNNGAAAVREAAVSESDILAKAPVAADKESEAESPETAGSEGDQESRGQDGRISEDASYAEIKARRQLEEIRLKMTLEAAALLEKKGFNTQTQQLGKVVDALRELEDSYYMRFFKEADTKTAEEALRLLKDTTLSIGQLKYIPSFVLGSTLQDRHTQTIPGLLEEGGKLKAELDKAGAAYDTMMTVPNKEYGDSIKKAFANMDSMLSELNIEDTQQNRRAVRILGYNRMEINEESIRQVKAYDLQVSTMIKNLNPAVTVRMIKEGINPLQMPVEELNRTAERIREEQGITSEDKYSTYLRKLEKENGITEQERKQYIGIYRLLYNVEKSDGAALGAVVRAGREITLNNLLTAVQTGKKGGLDTVINDEFGTLQEINRTKESISEQLNSFNSGADNQNQEQTMKENTAREITEYLDRILRQVKEELTPGKLKEAGESLAQQGREPGSTGLIQDQTSAAASILASQPGIWESVKNVPVERLYEQLQNGQLQDTAEDEVYTRKVQEIRELCKNSEQAIRFLNDYQVPSTPVNIMLANRILSSGESPVKKLLKLQKENIVEKTENSLKNPDELSDKLIDKQSMEEAYGQLENETKEAITGACSQEILDSFKLAELKSLGQQMALTRKLAEKEFYQIPIETSKGITNLNLTIIRGTEETGKVSVTVWSEKLGNVKADFSLKGKTLKGLISSGSRTGLEQLQRNAGELKKAAEESSVVLKQLDFALQGKENDTYSYQNPGMEENETSMKAETERTLYRIAKALVLTVRTAESGGEDLAAS